MIKKSIISMRKLMAVVSLILICTTTYASTVTHQIYVNTSRSRVIGAKWSNQEAVDRLNKNCAEKYQGVLDPKSIDVAVGFWSRLPIVVFGKCTVNIK
ncbi:MAG: hypothetical protein V4596_13455 [Bdellovibrionota bacterium]